MFDQPLNVPLSSRYNSVQCTQSCGSSPHSVITPDTGTDLLDDLLSHKLLPMNDNIVVKTKLTTDVMIIYHYNARTPIQMQYTTISLKYFFNSHISYRTWTPLSMSTTKEHGFHIALRLWCVSAPTVHCTVRVGLSPVCCYMCDLTRSSTKTFFLSIHLSSAEYSGLAHFTESLNAPTPPPECLYCSPPAIIPSPSVSPCLCVVIGSSCDRVTAVWSEQLQETGSGQNSHSCLQVSLIFRVLHSYLEELGFGRRVIYLGQK